MNFFAGDLIVGHPNPKEGSNAATTSSCASASITEADIVYTKEDNVAIDIYHRENGSYYLSHFFYVVAAY